MIIDCHSHIYPEKIAAKALEATWEFYKIPMNCEGTAEDLLERGRRGGIGRFIVFSAAASAAQVPRINSFIAEVCAGREALTGFGTLHPDVEDPAAEVDAIVKAGLRGVKFHPDMQRFNIDDPRMMGVYALLEGRLPVIFHTGDYRYSYSHPRRLAAVLDAFPRLVVVAAHFGGWTLHDLALEYFLKRRCFFDVSSSLPFIGERRAEELIRAYGAERFLFGSDYPMWDPAQCLAEFLRLRLTTREQELILSQNAARFLGEQ